MSKTILSFRQKALLRLFAADPNIQNSFYLSGGTALAEYYLHHRFSEDLDYFSEQEVDPMSIQVYLKSISSQIDIKKIDRRRFKI